MQPLDTLTRYGVPAAADRPLERVLRWLAELDDALRTIDPTCEPLVDAAMRIDVRRYFFMLEGICRLYRERYGDDAKRVWRRVKKMEDALGRVDYTRAMHAAAKRFKAPKKARTFLREARDKAERKLRKQLRAEWCPDSKGSIPGVARLVEASGAFPWDDPATDRRYLSGQIAAELEAIEHDDLDMEELEEGVHELRRSIRWFPIYLFALSGFASLDESLNPIPEYEPLLRSDAAKSKYAALAANPRETSPIQVSRSLFIANSVYVGELGDLKDDGQTIEGLAFALRKSGVKKKASRAEKKAIELMDLEPGRMHAIHERSAAIYDEMKSRRLCHHLAEPFRRAGVRCRGTESAAVRSQCPHP